MAWAKYQGPFLSDPVAAHLVGSLEGVWTVYSSLRQSPWPRAPSSPSIPSLQSPVPQQSSSHPIQKYQGEKNHCSFPLKVYANNLGWEGDVKHGNQASKCRQGQPHFMTDTLNIYHKQMHSINFISNPLTCQSESRAAQIESSCTSRMTLL